MKMRIWFSANDVFYISAVSNSPAFTGIDGKPVLPNGIAVVYYQSDKAKYKLPEDKCWVVRYGAGACADLAMQEAIARLTALYGGLAPSFAEVKDQTTELRRLLKACEDVCNQGT